MTLDCAYLLTKMFHSFVPVKEKRRALKGQLEAYKIATIVDGDKKRKPRFKELKGWSVIKAGKGVDNHLFLHTPLHKNHVHILMSGSHNTLDLGSNFEGGMSIWFNDSNALVKIGKNCIFAHVDFFPSFCNIEVGEDTMMSRDVEIWGHDQHVILDAKTKKLLNAEKTTLHIGNHCWIGAGASILKNGTIPDNTIVGTHAVVTKPYTQPYTALGGNPAKLIKTDISWSTETVDLYLKTHKE